MKLGSIILLLLFLSSCFRSNSHFFEIFFGHKPGPEIQNLEVHASEIGLDASYWLAFSCNDSTYESLVKDMSLELVDKPTHGLYGGFNSHPEAWWDTSVVYHSLPFHKEKDRIHHYLWRDTANQRVFYLNFDL